MNSNTRGLGLLVCLALAGVGLTPARAQTPLTALVDLDARDPSAGTPTWKNAGLLGPFTRVGNPRVETIAGIRAVTFDGLHDLYRGPLSVPALEGVAQRTIEVWAYNPSIDADEETVLAWGKRGGPAGTAFSLNWGRSPEYGAFTHWAEDLGWNGVPKPKQWHLLAYTYDGKTARVYDDSVEKSARDLMLDTASGNTINLAAQNGPDGRPALVNPDNGQQIAGSLSIASVRILPGALTPEQLAKDFEADAARFGATRPVSLLQKGRDEFTVGAWALSLLRATGTAAALSPSGTAFDFLPGDRLAQRLGDGSYQLGDLTLRTRTGMGAWQSFSTASDREDDVLPLTRSGTLAAADLSPVLGANCPLAVTREWVNDAGRLALRFRLTNKTTQPVEIGALGVPMVFNNLLTGRSLEETHEKCAFATPAVNGEGGYLQVTRLNGHGPALLVMPEKGVSFEAYRPLYDDPTPRGVTFEGFYEWMAHSKAYAENEWKGAAGNWNPPTSRILPPGASATYGFRFALAPSIREIEPTLIAEKRPVAVGVPGYVLPTDQTGRLFLHSAQPLQFLAVQPSGALHWQPDGKPTPHGWQGYTLRGAKPGRCRLVITYAGGLHQSISYFVTPPEAEQVRRLGAFHAAKQWFDDPKDPFHRTDSFLPFNRKTGQMVVQHPHSWFVGLSDEIGAGASVAVAMKNWGQPNAHEIALLEKYADTALWGHLQNPDYSVRAGLFYYDPQEFPNYYQYHGTDWVFWDKARTETTWRAFNYPHVTAVYYALYHLARDHRGLVTAHAWDYYLDHAFHTALAIQQFAPDLAQFGLMLGSVFPDVVRDLRREGWNDKADLLEGYMKTREARWKTLRYPFGSEMPWDSTGQEEVYTWSRYFGDDDKAQVTLDAVTGYMPTVPNWAYNGAARRYFDAPVNGNYWTEIVQTTNHYGSAINAIPVLDAYKRDPTDFYLLRIGYAGMDQILANIDAQGFASYGFNTDPAHLDFDPYTADYGIAFFGYARNAGTYVVKHPEFGWLGFGGDVQPQANGKIRVTPRDGFRRRVFLAPLGLWLTLDAGAFQWVTFDPHTKSVQVTFAPASSATPTALLRIGQMPTGTLPAKFAPPLGTSMVRGAYAVRLGARPITLTLTPISPTPERPVKTLTYTNPLHFGTKTGREGHDELRDPCILKEGDTYYLVFTMWPFTDRADQDAAKPDRNSSPGIRLYSSKDLTHWTPGPWLVKSSDLPDSSPYKHRFWAPEIHKIGGKFYLVFTADNWLKPEYNATGQFGYHAFLGVADKVIGPYKHISYLPDSACDTTIFGDVDGRVYAFMPFGDLFVQELDLSRLAEGKVSYKTPRQKIVSSDFSDIGQPSPKYLEGPWVMKQGERYYLFYAENYADGYWTGVATADHPLGPWKKDPRGRVFWGGHLAVFDGSDGRHWFSYRGEKLRPTWGLLCVDPFDIGADGRVHCGEPTMAAVTVAQRRRK